MKTQLSTIAQYLLALGLFLGPLGCATVKHDWEEAQRADTITAYEEFLQKHSDGEQTDLATNRLAELHATNDWSSALRTNTIGGYEEFLQKHPNAHQSTQAKNRINDLAFITDWSRALSTNTVDEYRMFIDKYPETEETRFAKIRMAELEDSNNWIAARSAGSITSLDEFVSKYPSSAYLDDAKRLRVKLAEELDWKLAQEANSPIAIQDFLKRYPSSIFSKEATNRLQDEAWLFRNAMERVEFELRPVRELFLEAKEAKRSLTGKEFDQVANEYRRVRVVFKQVRLDSHAANMKPLYDGWETYLSEQAVCHDKSADRMHMSEGLPVFLGQSALYFVFPNPIQVFNSVVYAYKAVKIATTEIETCNKAAASLKNLNTLHGTKYLEK